MDTQILTTKLYIPPVRSDLVPRPRLLQRLDEGLRPGHKLTLVSAPAGYGKTTLLSEWIQAIGGAAPSIAVAWLSLDKGDNDPTRFFVYLVAALQTVRAGVGESLLGALRSTRAPPVQASLATLINEVSTLAPPLVFVLDDYHTIKSKPIHGAVAFLIDHLPGNIHLVITTRADPPLPLARLRGRGQLVDLRQADLRFTAEEVSTFLNQTMGLALLPDQVAALASRTEGWIAGLRMAVISMQGRRDLSRYLQELTGSHRFILDYLTEEVLDQQPAAIQRFLLQTSVLDRLTAPLCDAVMGRGTGGIERAADSQETLESLDRANLFVVPLDDRREWYRYHRLFADLLRRRLHRSRPDLVPILHSRASAWYERQARDLDWARRGNGLMAAAIDHAFSAGDTEHAAHLIEESADSIMLRSEMATLRRWIEALPDEVTRAHPLLCVCHAVALVLSGQPLEVAEARIQDALATADRDTVSGEVVALRALLAAYREDAQQCTELSEQALALLPEDRLFFRSFVVGFLGLNYLYQGEVAAATRVFDEAARIGQQAGNRVIAVLATVHLAELASIQGKLDDAVTFYERALQLATDAQGHRMPIAGVALIGLGQVARARHELENAARRYTEGIDLAMRWGKTAAMDGYVGLAHVRQAQGDVAGAGEAIRTAEQIALEFDAMQVDDVFVAIHKHLLLLAQGNVEAVQQWLDERGVTKDAAREDFAPRAAGATASFMRAVEYMLLAQVYVVRGRGDDALELLAPLLARSEAAGWTRVKIWLLALEALAWLAKQDQERAMSCLTEALLLAEPEGYVQAFVGLGEPMERLLAAFTRKPSVVSADYVHRLLEASNASRSESRPSGPLAQQPHPQPTTRVRKPLSDSLSPRELQVLRFLNTHLSSTEIAEELYLSVHTVRSHIKNVYSKLDVHGRAEAVSRAKELDLL
jgi:LuxR family maltose regulon positive regulatory protein